MGGEVAVCLRRSLYKISCIGIDDDNITRALILYVERGRALEARPKLPHNSVCMPFKVREVVLVTPLRSGARISCKLNY